MKKYIIQGVCISMFLFLSALWNKPAYAKCEAWCGSCGYTFISCGSYCPGSSSCSRAGSTDLRTLNGGGTNTTANNTKPTQTYTDPKNGNTVAVAQPGTIATAGNPTSVTSGSPVSSGGKTVPSSQWSVNTNVRCEPGSAGCPSTCTVAGGSTCYMKSMTCTQNGVCTLSQSSSMNGQTLTVYRCLSPLVAGKCLDAVAQTFTVQAGQTIDFSSYLGGTAGGCGSMQADIGGSGANGTVTINTGTTCSGAPASSNNTTQTATLTATNNTPPAQTSGQCTRIKVYKGTSVVDPTTLQAGDSVTLGVAGTSATQGRIRVNGAAFVTSTTKNANGEYIVPFTVPPGVTSFTIEGEVYTNGQWL